MYTHTYMYLCVCVYTRAIYIVFIVTLFKVAKKWKQTKCRSTDEWMKCGIFIQWNTVCQ